MRFPTAILVLLPLVVPAFPNAPLKTSNQWILDSTGANFTYVGVNWPGAGEVMIPEGLQYQSIASIVSKIQSLNMNVVRLTFAIEMIDDIKDRGGDITIQKAFQKALGSKGDAVYANVVKNNPQFNANTTRLQVRTTLRTVRRWLIRCRSSMPSPQNLRSSRYTCISITTCRRGGGVAVAATGTLGLETRTSTSTTGNVVCSSWLNTYALTPLVCLLRH
jgi:hypothetical protein